MDIGEVSRRSGLSEAMIRHYESSGFIEVVDASEVGRGAYNQSHVDALRFIRRSRDIGFSSFDIRKLLTFWQDPERVSAEVKALARARADELGRKARELESMRNSLESLAATCHGGQGSRCPIIEDLSEPDLPAADPPATGIRENI